jgi:hypothetical protein
MHAIGISKRRTDRILIDLFILYKKKPTGPGEVFLNLKKTRFELLPSAIFHCYPAFRARSAK